MVLTCLTEKFVTRTLWMWATNLIRKEIILINMCLFEQQISWKFTTYLRIFLLHLYFIAKVLCEYLQSNKYLFKKFHFFFSFFLVTCFHSNCITFSENMKKYIEIIVLKFKINTINYQRDTAVFNKYFLTVHAPTITKIFFQNFTP